MKKTTLLVLSAALTGATFNGTIFAQQQIQNVPQLGVSKIAAPLQPIQQLAIIQNQPQNQPPCLADEITNVYIQQQLLQNPNYQTMINKQNNQIQQLMQINAMAKANVVRTIPVVVHVVYNTGAQNVSDANIFAMLNTMNEDFRRQNADASNTRPQFAGVAADAEIEFCLASKDPSGVATNGITRTSSAEVSFNPDTETNKMKDDATNGKTGWNAYDYLNIWVCNLAGGSGAIGYAYLPTPGMHGSDIDGLVIDYTVVGAGDRTATHEIGHYLGCKHTWGNNPPSCGNDDGFTDTPNCSDENYGCNFSLNTCATPNGDQIENYMSYAYCQNMFTIQQANYMNSILSGVRSSLLSSDGCEPTAPPVAAFTADKTTVQVGGWVVFTDTSTGVPSTWSWNFGGGGTPNTSAVKNPTIQFNTIGTYTVTLSVSNVLGSDTETKTAYINVVAVTGCDTLLWPFPGTGNYYYPVDADATPDSGYFFGKNAYNINPHAQKFLTTQYSPYTHITGGLFAFAIAYDASGGTSTVDFNVWNNTGPGGTPGTILGTKSVPLSDIVTDVQGNFYTNVLFASPVAVSTDVFLGFTMNLGAGDTLASIANGQGEGTGINSWMNYLGTWYDVPTLFGTGPIDLHAVPFFTNQPPTASFTANTTSGCKGLTVTFDASASVNADYYYWDVDGDGLYDYLDTVDATISITYDTVGTFSVTLLVVGPCTGLDSVKQTNYITIYPDFTLATTKVDATCGSCNGSATANPTGGTSPFTYLWTDPSSQTTQTAGALCPGSYQVQVNDANGCSRTSGATITDGAGLSVSASSTPDTCSSSVGTATASASGGTPGYTYSWSTTPVQTTITATGLSAGTYNVTVTDQNGCNVTTDFFSAASVGNVIDTTIIAGVTISGNATICTGDNVTFTATPAYGGTPAYQWKVNGVNAGTNSATYSTTALINGDVITCIMTSSLACATGSPATSNAITMTVNTPVAVSVTISGSNTICAGDNLTFTAVPANGGTPAYQWQVNGGNAGTNSSTYSTSTLNNGDVVTCIMTSSLSCITGSPATSNALTINVNPLPIINTQTATNATSCTVNDGTITITASGGTSPLLYSINGGATFSASGNFTGLSTGSYPVVVSDTNNCEVTGSVLVITAPGAPSAPTAGTNATYCDGDSVADLTATGTNIEWFSDPGLTTSLGTGSPFAISPDTGTTTYYVTQTVSGCESPSASVVITVNPNPLTPTISESGGILISSSSTGNQWFFNGDTIAGATSLFYTPVQNGFYTVTVTDVNGCSSTSAAFPFNPIGIEESASAYMLNIYPNPTTGKVAVAGGSSSISSIEIYNAMGEKVTGYWSLVTGKQPAASSQQPVTIDLSGKAEGLYFIYIMTNDRVFVRKVSLVK